MGEANEKLLTTRRSLGITSLIGSASPVREKHDGFASAARAIMTELTPTVAAVSGRKDISQNLSIKATERK